MDNKFTISPKIILFFSILVIIQFYVSVKAQIKRSLSAPHEDTFEKIIYLSPLPCADNVMPGSDIILGIRNKVNKESLNSGDLIRVTGSKSGLHSGKVILSADNRTVIYRPDLPFALGEKVTVGLNRGIESLNGKIIQDTVFAFTIRKSGYIPISKEILLSSLEENIAGRKISSSNKGAEMIGKINSIKDLPDDFPELTVNETNNPTKGYIFLAAFGSNSENQYSNYLIIADNNGNPVYYKKTSAMCTDFKMQPNGTISYYDGSQKKFYVMNTSFSVIDSFACSNGYQTDVHELRVLPNGDALLLGDDYREIDMSKIVPGGNPNATVIDNVVQELDKNKNVIFQWRGLDHFKVTDATHQDLTAEDIDYAHMNAIETDGDSCILLSSRHMDEITKISLLTGDIIWRLGGKNNQFNFVNDDIGFSHQHAIRKLTNGDIVLFDDGNFHDPPFSRAVEYKLDEINKTATLVWQYRNSPDIYGSAMGYVQRLDDGNTLIGWGNTNPSVTEVTPEGDIALEMTLPAGIYSYRAYRFPFIILNSPNGKEEWNSSSVHNILWTSSGVKSVFIDYSTDGGKSWSRITSSFPADSGKYIWVTPDKVSQNCMVRVGDASMPSITDISKSDSTFEIDSSFSVELSSFESSFTDNTVYLSWQTNKEQNNSGFEIQRKFAAGNWDNIGFIQSKAEQSLPAEYNFTDAIDTTSLEGNVFYRLAQIDSAGGVNYLKQLKLNVDIVPANYILMNNYPNPFNPSTVIKFSLPYDSHVELNIYNTLGQLVERLFDSNQSAGDHKVIFNASKFSSGIYFDEMRAAPLDGRHSFRTVKKMVYIK